MTSPLKSSKKVRLDKENSIPETHAFEIPTNECTRHSYSSLKGSFGYRDINSDISPRPSSIDKEYGPSQSISDTTRLVERQILDSPFHSDDPDCQHTSLETRPGMKDEQRCSDPVAQTLLWMEDWNPYSIESDDFQNNNITPPTKVLSRKTVLMDDSDGFCILRPQVQRSSTQIEDIIRKDWFSPETKSCGM